MRKVNLLLVFIFFISAFTSFAQMSQQARDSIAKLSQQDHQLIMQKLGIESFRPGPSGNPEAPNAANKDESKATPYTSLPDPLVFDNGIPLKSPRDWKQRKLEIKEHFASEVYGRIPENTPSVTWEIIEEKDSLFGEVPARFKKLLGHVDNSSYPEIEVTIEMMMATPLEVKKAVPLVMQFSWIWPASMQRPRPQGATWQEQMLKEGWGFAMLIPTSFQVDNGSGLRSGIIGLVNKGQPRKLDDWGTLRAWGWGASRALDYLETDSSVDAKRVAIEGLSRYGKAALVAMVDEPRFAIGFLASSGAGGAKIFRRVYGEQVENLASSGEYHWFTPNFIKYAGPLTPMDLPVDAHEMVALCAPRPVFISGGDPEVEGHWIDAVGMFKTAVAATPVYEFLGKKGIETDTYPGTNIGLMEGDLAFRQHDGGHTEGPNWAYFIEFAKRYFH
ncbi:glucuronyl esterase domain-containing protein [Algoriphagus pacificus]|uniref:Acetylxylan esterase n=1 Tax=Algoriphagus pacificus TaxID=2811234 RepID=A0ABS3CCI6_9BACT|nr:acetylxylan esterase [Algoriphagus pacificus]MBN7814530.1 acetylxylan esterase [Algoriphagus pacificus]